jgi:hypothetical protein
MTTFWGPLGWATLHSASLTYSDQPSREEQLIMDRFIDCFQTTITCFTCKTHFIEIYSAYKSSNPNYLSSRAELGLFVMRAHNMVNRKLDKPVLPSAEICLETLKNMEPYFSFSARRQAYLEYLHRNWNKEVNSDGFIARKCVQEMIKINNEYLNPRQMNWEPFEGSVVVYNPPKVVSTRKRIGGFKNGKLISQ